MKGVMIGGFALVAAPAEYGVTGVKTFIVSHDGVIYEKGFRSQDSRGVQEMERFNPDKSWTPVRTKTNEEPSPAESSPKRHFKAIPPPPPPFPQTVKNPPTPSSPTPLPPETTANSVSCHLSGHGLLVSAEIDFHKCIYSGGQHEPI